MAIIYYRRIIAPEGAHFPLEPSGIESCLLFSLEPSGIESCLLFSLEPSGIESCLLFSLEPSGLESCLFGLKTYCKYMSTRGETLRENS